MAKKMSFFAILANLQALFFTNVTSSFNEGR